MDIGFLMAATAECGDLAEIARTLEQLGYESLWIAEHPVIPVGMQTRFPFTPDGKLPDHYARWADPFIALTIAAAVTKKLKLGTGVCLLPERETLVTAKVAASLDVFSGGRLLMGVGAGWLREETEAMGANFGLRWKQTREAVEAMRLLWTQREASYQGEMIKFPAAAFGAQADSEGGSARASGRARPQGAGAGGAHVRRMDAAGREPRGVESQRRATPQAHGRARARSRLDPDIAADRARRKWPLSRRGEALSRGRRDPPHSSFSQKMIAEAADGKALEAIRRLASSVDRARAI